MWPLSGPIECQLLALIGVTGAVINFTRRSCCMNDLSVEFMLACWHCILKMF